MTEYWNKAIIKHDSNGSRGAPGVMDLSSPTIVHMDQISSSGCDVLLRSPEPNLIWRNSKYWVEVVGKERKKEIFWLDLDEKKMLTRAQAIKKPSELSISHVI